MTQGAIVPLLSSKQALVLQVVKIFCIIRSAALEVLDLLFVFEGLFAYIESSEIIARPVANAVPARTLLHRQPDAYQYDNEPDDSCGIQ
jgi:hypothetical protein